MVKSVESKFLVDEELILSQIHKKKNQNKKHKQVKTWITETMNEEAILKNQGKLRQIHLHLQAENKGG
jgi:hypothetical protein